MLKLAWQPTRRVFSRLRTEQLRFEHTAASGLTPTESKVYELLKTHLTPTSLYVKDISGGCGSMFDIDIKSPKFAGLTPLKQQKLVHQVIGEEMRKWHGVHLQTKA